MPFIVATYVYACSPRADMRIVPMGSGGAILDLDWFLNYHDIKLVIKASEIEGKIVLLTYCTH